MAENAMQPWQTRKISQLEWPAIAERHHRGESFASIARAYNCTPPAIRYIIGRQRQLRGGEKAENSSSSAAAPSGAGQSAAGRGPSRQLAPATGLNAGLRDSTTGELANFLVSFDHALEKPTAASLASLRDATDRLLRAVARVRIALEPLADAPTRDAQD